MIANPIGVVDNSVFILYTYVQWAGGKTLKAFVWRMTLKLAYGEVCSDSSQEQGRKDAELFFS